MGGLHRGEIRLRSGGPHAGFASGEGVVGWRGSRTARVSPDDVRIRQAAPCTPGSGLSTRFPPGLLRPQPGQAAGVGLGIPARTLTHTWRVMSATGPDRPCVPHLAFRLVRTKTRPGGWLCTRLERGPPASGTPMASASFRALPHVTANPERPSSRLVENVRDPSGTGSPMMMAWGLAGGDETSGFFGQALGSVERADINHAQV